MRSSETIAETADIDNDDIDPDDLKNKQRFLEMLAKHEAYLHEPILGWAEGPWLTEFWPKKKAKVKPALCHCPNCGKAHARKAVKP